MKLPELPLIFSGVAVIVAIVSLSITIIYRRKDIYNQLLKEQISAAYQVMEELLKLTKEFNEGYTRVVGNQISLYLSKTNKMPSEDEIKLLQTSLLVQLDPKFSEAFNKILSRGFIFPQDLQKLIVDYFTCVSDLFENKNDMDLGISLKGLYNYVADITDKFNYYFKIDKLSKQMNRLL